MPVIRPRVADETSPASKTMKGKPVLACAAGHWKTPEELYVKLDEEFHFDFDPCPYNPAPVVDGLISPWGDVNFVNPPYDPDIHLWLKRGIAGQRHGKISVFLVPSSTDSAWWHNYAMLADEIRFLRGRLCFSGAKGTAPFASVILVYRGKNEHN